MGRTIEIDMNKVTQLCEIANKDLSELVALNLVMKGMEIQKALDATRVITQNTA